MKHITGTITGCWVRLGRASIISGLIVALVAAGATGLIEPSAASHAQQADRVTVEFWHSYPEMGPENAALWTVLIPQFERANPGVRVQPVAFPADDFRSTLLAVLASGDGPQVARVDGLWIPELADLGLLEPLDLVLPDFEPLAGAVFAGVRARMMWRGHTYGLPVDASTAIMVWNRGMFAVLDLEGPALLIDDLFPQCEAIHELSSRHYLFGPDGASPRALLPWLWTLGGEMIDPDLRRAAGVLDSAETAAAYTTLREMVQANCFDPSLLDANARALDHFLEGTTGAILAEPSIFPTAAAQELYISLDTAPLPAASSDTATIAEGHGIVLIAPSALSDANTPSTAQADAARAFVRFTQSDDYQLAMAEAGLVPARADLAASDIIQSHPYFGIYMHALLTARPLLPHPAWPRIEAILADASRRVLALQDEPEMPQVILSEAAARIDAILADYR